jgi:ubiquinone/menaquinone biosynthesis C-methylase UbiE
VLDVGGGTGTLASALSSGATYICVDNDPAKLARLKAKLPATAAVLGDVTRLPFADRSIDDAVSVAVTHHLSDHELKLFVGELARVARARVIVFDAILEPRSRRGSLLWRIDRGSHPRSAAKLAAALEGSLDCLQSERFSVHHHYLVWVGEPARSAE